MANQDSKQKKNDVMGMDPSQDRAQDAQQTQSNQEAGIPIQDSQRLEQDSNRQAQGRDRNQNAQGSDRKDSKDNVQEFPHQSVTDNAGKESGKEFPGQRNEGTGGYGGSDDQGRAGRQENQTNEKKDQKNESDDSKRKNPAA